MKRKMKKIHIYKMSKSGGEPYKKNNPLKKNFKKNLIQQAKK